MDLRSENIKGCCGYFPRNDETGAYFVFLFQRRLPWNKVSFTVMFAVVAIQAVTTRTQVASCGRSQAEHENNASRCQTFTVMFAVVAIQADVTTRTQVVS
jgi:hypothetical protein